MATKQTRDFEYKLPITSWFDYKPTLCAYHILDCRELLPSDKIIGITTERKEYQKLTGEYGDDGATYQYRIIIRALRTREETDEEFYDRITKAENERKDKEEKDRLLYLELKARFETNI